VTLAVDPNVQWYIDNKLTEQIHTSGRKAFRACRRRWDWVYREMYYPLVTPEPLEFGTAFHKAMETLYEPRMWASPLFVRRDLALVAFKRECEKHLKEYQKLNPDPDVTILESYKSRIELGLNMLRYYCETVSPLYDNNWTPVRVEVSFEVPIKNPDTGEQLWCKCNQCWSRFYKFATKNDVQTVEFGAGDEAQKIDFDRSWTNSSGQVSYTRDHLENGEHQFISWRGLPVTYGGRLDALFQDSLNRYWIADWKTTSRLLDEDQESSFLQLDDQIVSYLWALYQYGIQCAGFVYVEIKKNYPQPPERLSRLYKGRAFSTNKDFMTTHDMFLATVQKEDNAAWQMGLYDDHLLRLKTEGPRFTQRHQIHKNMHEIEEAGKVIAYEAMDMIGQPRIYPQPGRFSCNWCLFKQPCLGKNMGEDYLYTLDTLFERKTLHYWEQKEASTD